MTAPPKTTVKHTISGKKSPRGDRREKLSQALRKNLLRRKAASKDKP